MKFIPSSPFLFNAFRYYADDDNVLKLIYDDSFESFLQVTKYYIKQDGDKFVTFAHDPGYGSCYSMGSIEDSTKDIYDMLYKQAEIFRNAGGFGVNFSKLRSKHAFVKTIKGKSSGAVSFMDLYNQTTELIALSSRLKRGANMFILNVYHPEIEEFINVKTDVENGYQKLKYANISVGIDDKFIDDVIYDREYETVDPHDPNIRFTKRARKIFTNLVLNSTAHAEPGILNFDNINKDYIANSYDRITSVNPCSEYVSRDQSVCVLGSVNLYAFLKLDDNDQIYFDFDELYKTTKLLHRFLTYANFANIHIFDILTFNTRSMRNTGVGFMGLSSVFIMLKLRYGTKESVEFTRKILQTMNDAVFESTITVSNEIGAFPEFFTNVIPILEEQIKKYGLSEGRSGTIFTGAYWKSHLYYDSNEYMDVKDTDIYFAFNMSNPDTYYLIGEYDTIDNSIKIVRKIGNMRFLAIAPTGSISYIAGVSSGVEPIFSLAYKRTINKDMPTEYTVVVTDSAIEDYLRYHKKYNDTQIKEILTMLSNGDVMDFDDYVVTNNEIGFERINVINVVNLHIDMNTSVTFNILQSQTLQNFVDQLKNVEIEKCIRDEVEKKFNDFLTTFDFRKEIIDILNENDQARRVVASYVEKWFVDEDKQDGKVYRQIYHKKYDVPEFDRFVSLVAMVASFYILSSLTKTKGVTVYVENSRSPVLQVVTNKKKDRKPLELDFSMKLEGASAMEDSLVGVQLESKKHNLVRTSKGYYVDSNGKKICPICGHELTLGEGCISCQSCGWSACM